MSPLCTILRHLFYTAAAVSMLLLLGTLVLWPVSYYRYVHAGHFVPNGTWNLLGFENGRIYLIHQMIGFSEAAGSFDLIVRKAYPNEESQWSYLTWKTPVIADESVSTSLGVGWIGDFGISGFSAELYIPLSYQVLLFSILPLVAFRSIRRRRKASQIGLCPKCGYDVCAQREGAGGAVCPECGASVR